MTDPSPVKNNSEAKDRAVQIAEVARSKHADEVSVLLVSNLTTLADFFVFCSAESETQLRAIAEAVDDCLSKQGTLPMGVEGREAGNWILMDYNDVILHIFKKESRAFYDLDRLWGDAPKIVLPDLTETQ
ncbi:MAG: ribosome silencing factor, partial [Nitrospiria bacterium]